MGIDRMRTYARELGLAEDQRKDVQRQGARDVGRIRQKISDRDRRMAEAEKYEYANYTPKQYQKDKDEGTFDFYTFAEENPDATPDQLARKFNEVGEEKVARVYRGKDGGFITETQYGDKIVISAPKVNAMRKYHADLAKQQQQTKLKEDAEERKADRIEKRQLKMSNAALRKSLKLKGAVKYDPKDPVHNSAAMRIVEVGKQKLVIKSDAAKNLEKEGIILDKELRAQDAKRQQKVDEAIARAEGATAKLDALETAMDVDRNTLDANKAALDAFLNQKKFDGEIKKAKTTAEYGRLKAEVEQAQQRANNSMKAWQAGLAKAREAAGEATSLKGADAEADKQAKLAMDKYERSRRKLKLSVNPKTRKRRARDLRKLLVKTVDSVKKVLETVTEPKRRMEILRDKGILYGNDVFKPGVLEFGKLYTLDGKEYFVYEGPDDPDKKDFMDFATDWSRKVNIK